MNIDQIGAEGIIKAGPAALPQDNPEGDKVSSIQSDPDAFSNALSIVVHDLRGPLSNLAILVEDIARSSQGDPDTRIARNAMRADRTIQQLSGMLNAVLKRARTSRDPLSCDRARVDLQRILELAVAVNRPLARRRSVSFRCHAFKPVTVFGDQELLFEALDNLIGNAVRHTRPGSTVNCEVGPASDGCVYVRISDEGPGFTAADLGRAFRPFARLSSRADATQPSTGLGLWISKVITVRHGGRIAVRNRRGSIGAELTVLLPSAKAETPVLAM